MNSFESIKDNYNNGRWSIELVKTAVVFEWITAEQYHEITGYKYDE